MQGADEGEKAVAVLDDVCAGSSLESMSIMCLDGAGRPAASIKGRISTSWSRGAKRITLKEGIPVLLPHLLVRPFHP